MTLMRGFFGLGLVALGVASCLGDMEEASDVGPMGDHSAELILCSSGSTVQGIDVSSYQGVVNWTAVKKAGKSFAWIRVSDGVRHPDAQFSNSWPAARDAGLIRGAYQHFRGGQDPIQQANLLIEKVGTLGAGDLPAVMDIEGLDGQSVDTVIFRMRTWLSAVQAGTGKVPVIYTNISTWSALGDPQGFASYPLWVAHWGPSCPSLPVGWSTWRFWQYSNRGFIAGIDVAADLDEFNGSIDILRSFAGLGRSCIFGDGLYCGGNGVIGDPRTLFRCTDGQIAIDEACASGCVPMPATTRDQCAVGPCPLGDGLYCGGNLVGGDYSTLYRCSGGSLHAVRWCPSGCRYMPHGFDDQCI